MAAPTMNQRQECYLARDEFYECMVKNNEQVEACATQRQKYNSKCLSSWVKYFDRKRVYDEYKKKLETAGYQPLPEKNGEQ